MSQQPKRRILLSDIVNSGTAKEVIQAIIDINEYDREQEKRTDYVTQPIELVVNSFGGSAYDGFAIIAAMDESQTPVHTISMGSSMSMGLAIFLAGEKRVMHTMSTLMYHAVSNFSYGQIEDHKRNLKEMERLQELYDQVIINNSNVEQSKLDSYKDKVKDWFIDCEEAIKFGMVDEVFGTETTMPKSLMRAKRAQESVGKRGRKQKRNDKD